MSAHAQRPAELSQDHLWLKFKVSGGCVHVVLICSTCRIVVGDPVDAFARHALLTDGAPVHICAGTGLTPVHICAGTGLTLSTSAPGPALRLPQLSGGRSTGC